MSFDKNPCKESKKMKKCTLEIKRVIWQIAYCYQWKGITRFLQEICNANFTEHN